jgi:hypothetical protein
MLFPCRTPQRKYSLVRMTKTASVVEEQAALSFEFEFCGTKT